MADTSDSSFNLKPVAYNSRGANIGEFASYDIMVSDDDSLNIFSLNLHGLNQGKPSIDEIIGDFSPDILFVQEHWLTPDNLTKLSVWDNFMMFGSSAMLSIVESGPLYGRPYGGVAILVNKRLSSVCNFVSSSDRYIVLAIADYLLVNVYLPCLGTDNRLTQYNEILNEIWSIREQFPDHTCLFGGDFNVDLMKSDYCSDLLKSFLLEHSLLNSYDLFPDRKCFTYVNESLGHFSTLDYFFVSNPDNLVDFSVVELANNFSDHLPINCRLRLKTDLSYCQGDRNRVDSINRKDQFLRWDHADLGRYYESTRIALEPIVSRVNYLIGCLDSLCLEDTQNMVGNVIDDIACVLLSSSSFCVPSVRKSFFKFWWDTELDLLKQASVDAFVLWKQVGRPRQGSFFENKQRARLQYRNAIRGKQRSEMDAYSNDLHENLVRKEPNAFWRSWRSSFNVDSSDLVVEKVSDHAEVLSKFDKHFRRLASESTSSQADELRVKLEEVRRQYLGHPFDSLNCFDAHLVSECIFSFKNGKACGLDNISAEHLKFSHPSICLILSKLFSIMLHIGFVPASFHQSYTVPLLKNNDNRSRAVTCDDFRGIAISSVLSKTFEKCLLAVFSDYLVTEDNQFGFKKGLGCAHAIHSATKLMEHLIKGNSTVNLCALDISKAYDTVNHCGLLLKLIDRNVPLCFLELIETWYPSCVTCIKWKNLFADFFEIKIGVRQGSCLAPAFFAMYINDIIKACNASKLGHIIVYADDILLITRSVYLLQRIFDSVHEALRYLDLRLNLKKSVCMRIGPRHDSVCANICTTDGAVLNWVKQIRYLGVFFTSGRTVGCNFDFAKRSFNRAANSILGKLGVRGHEDVLVQLINAKCMPILLYGTEACVVSKRLVSSLDFTVVRLYMKIFKTGNRATIDDILYYFGVRLPSVCISERQRRLALRVNCTDNSFCHMVSSLA